MPHSAASYVGRLAPSPTGLLHLGHARTFWLAWQRAKDANGKLWLRDEDLDHQRSRPEFATAMRDDLRWLGITWEDELRQSERIDTYRTAAEQLVVASLAYRCTCSRKDLLAAVQAPHEETDEPVYSGRCRGNAAERTFDPASSYRLRVPDGERITFVDGHFGEQTFRAGCRHAAADFGDFGDFLIWRKDGLPSYQLACVVDDAAMQITEVVRGADLLDNTPRGKELRMRTPMDRFGRTEEVVGAAVYLASDAASFVTGQVLVVDGGFLASGVNQ